MGTALGHNGERLAPWEPARFAGLLEDSTMTPLRQRMIREMQLQQFSPRTIDSYVEAVFGLCKHYKRSPDQIGIEEVRDRKSTRLNSSHLGISYAVFCLKKKKKK